jgi:dTDP-4-dehydrorhamnose 3,5-epimerase
LWIPEGFAHGFLALREGTEVLYKASDLYAPECEGGLIWNDPALSIAWPTMGPSLSVRDQRWMPLKA